MITREALIEQAGRFIALNSGPLGTHYLDHAQHAAEAVVPIVVRAVTAEVRKLHEPVRTQERLPNGVTVPWAACSCGFRTRSACPTVRLCDDLDANLGGAL